MITMLQKYKLYQSKMNWEWERIGEKWIFGRNTLWVTITGILMVFVFLSFSCSFSLRLFWHVQFPYLLAFYSWQIWSSHTQKHSVCNQKIRNWTTGNQRESKDLQAYQNGECRQPIHQEMRCKMNLYRQVSKIPLVILEAVKLTNPRSFLVQMESHVELVIQSWPFPPPCVGLKKTKTPMKIHQVV